MSTTTNSTVPPDFDPYTQAFTLLGPDGTPFSITVADLDYWRLYGVRLAINYGSQIGATSILLFMLLLLTKSQKRRSWIFILNALCLVTNTVRSILYSLFLTGNYFNPYAIFSGDYSRVTSSNRATTIAANTMTLIVVILVMMSLGMQVWVVCITTPKIQRILIMSVATIFALFAVGYRFALTAIGNALAMKDEGLENHTGLQKQTQIFITVAIWIYCLVFTFKLGDAIFQRRKLGMTQFGPMQIIFIMGCQTMIVPAIFTILQFHDQVPELGTQTLTIVSIFLPLSAIWAGVITSDAHIGSSGPDAHRRLIAGQFDRTPLGSLANEKGSMIASTLATDKDPDSPTSMRTFGLKGKGSVDGGIKIENQFSIDVEKGEGSTVYRQF